MRKIIASEFLTLDGVMEAPEKWSFPFQNDETAKFKSDELFASDALLLGRETYQIFEASWPSRTGEFADRMNGLPKFVASTTLKKAGWNNSKLIKGGIAEEVTWLKQQPGGNLLIVGSATLVHTLMQHGLIDEYRFMIMPILLGSGRQFFKEGSDRITVRLVDRRPFSSGAIALIYHADGKSS